MTTQNGQDKGFSNQPAKDSPRDKALRADSPDVSKKGGQGSASSSTAAVSDKSGRRDPSGAMPGAGTAPSAGSPKAVKSSSSASSAPSGAASDAKPKTAGPAAGSAGSGASGSGSQGSRSAGAGKAGGAASAANGKSNNSDAPLKKRRKKSKAVWLVPAVIIAAGAGAAAIYYQHHHYHHHPHEESPATQPALDAPHPAESSAAQDDAGAGTEVPSAAPEYASAEDQHRADQSSAAAAEAGAEHPDQEHSPASHVEPEHSPENPASAAASDQPESQTDNPDPASAKPEDAVPDNTGSAAEQGSPQPPQQPADAESRDSTGEQSASESSAAGTLSQRPDGALEGRIAKLESQLAAAPTLDENKLLLRDTQRLLRNAEIQLQLNGNQYNALALLEFAKKQLETTHSHDMDGVIQALSSDIAKVKSAEPLNLDEKFKQLEQISAQLDQAAVKHSTAAQKQLADQEKAARKLQAQQDAAQSSANQSADEHPHADGEKWYQRSWSEVRAFSGKAYDKVSEGLGSMVKLEKMDGPELGLITIEDSQLIKDRLKIKLSMAQQALLNRQQAVWTTSLQSVSAALKHYFDAGSPAASGLINQIDQLSHTALNKQMPSLEASKNAVRQSLGQLSSAQDNSQE